VLLQPAGLVGQRLLRLRRQIGAVGREIDDVADVDGKVTRRPRRCRAVAAKFAFGLGRIRASRQQQRHSEARQDWASRSVPLRQRHAVPLVFATTALRAANRFPIWLPCLTKASFKNVSAAASSGESCFAVATTTGRGRFSPQFTAPTAAKNQGRSMA